jgi:hypothetical protein
LIGTRAVCGMVVISLGELCDHYSFPPGLFKGILLDAACFSEDLFRIAYHN